MARLVLENERLRVTEINLPKGEKEELKSDCPHMRWTVLPQGSEFTPTPTFYEPGNSHLLEAESEEGYREYVFEFLQPPKYNEDQYREGLKAVSYPGDPGTKLMFENEYCAAWDFRVPANGGDERDMHQHTVDHFFVMLDLPCELEIFVPQDHESLADENGLVQNIKNAGCKLECPDLSQSFRYFKEVGKRGFDDDGKCKMLSAVHGVRNPRSEEFREYYLDLK